MPNRMARRQTERMGSHSVLLGRRARREWQSCHLGTDDVDGSLKSARPVREWRVSLVSADAAVVAPWWKGGSSDKATVANLGVRRPELQLQDGDISVGE